MTRGFFLDVVDEVAHHALVELCAERIDLDGVLVGEDPDERLFVGAEALHGGAEGLDIGIEIDVGGLNWAVAE